ncbi:hypothetical protein [Flavobacterium sp.]|uniref:hypothetical protein n=1 Tax=Flavobacterium sp. TaxID=239 RepID=UPI0024892A94|nr:hypothetical protein [Flavobacterium sp.]MDI1317417.1 hypothetical protein [Flavobacterium sp.]
MKHVTILTFIFYFFKFNIPVSAAKLPPTFWRFVSVAKFRRNYFLLKIKILAKRKRELITKFAISFPLFGFQPRVRETAFGGRAGKNGQIDHLIPEQIGHQFRFKLTTTFRSKLTTGFRLKLTT